MRQYITSITKGFCWPRNPSKGTIKGRIAELMEVSNEEGGNSEEKLERPILRFQDSEKVSRIQNKIFIW